jgi:hypothetical protein
MEQNVQHFALSQKVALGILSFKVYKDSSNHVVRRRIAFFPADRFSGFSSAFKQV